MRAAALALIAVFALCPAVPGGENADVFTSDDLHLAVTVLEDMQRAVEDNYSPREKVGSAFAASGRETRKALAGVHSNNEAYALIADLLASLDPRIRFYPPPHQVRVDYSWHWQLVGAAAYVSQVDREGDAARQGLRLGDTVRSFEGVAISRENYQLVDYTFNRLAPRPGLRILVESPGQEPRWLAVASTVRPLRAILASGGPNHPRLSWVLSETDERHRAEFLDLKQHLHHVGGTVVWRALELERDIGAVSDGVKELQGASAVVLDLRGENILRHEPAMALLDGLFLKGFEAGEIKRDHRFSEKLAVHGHSNAFAGTLLILVDANTGGYAELLARIVQDKQRGVIIGDRTMGRIFDAERVQHTRGTTFNFTAASVLLPVGDIVGADGASLAGQLVIPDLLLLPTGSDLAGRRDVVLAKALAMLKQPMSPEDAFKIVHLPSEDDDDNEW